MNVLTINAGSSSIKYKAYKVDADKTNLLVSGLIEGIGEIKCQWHHQVEKKETTDCLFKNHEEAFTALAQKLKKDLLNHPIQGVGHRVVHGGDVYFQPTIVNQEVLDTINKLSPLAPIHNPINALGIQFAQKHFPGALHVAIFDSAFHHTLPPHIRNYPINLELSQHYQVKHYGFHGINHEFVANTAAKYLNKRLINCNFISLHLGNGASACLIKEGKSFDTSMGMTPLAGLVMGSRCGDIDPAIPLYLMRQGLSLAEVDDLLNKQSGLKGIAGDNDMRRLIQRMEQQDELSTLAIDMYVYAIQKIVGAYLSQTSTLDALIFTGGVGENAFLIREKIIEPLSHLNFKLDPLKNRNLTQDSCQDVSAAGYPILVIRGDEEVLMAMKVEETIVNLF